MGASCRLSDVTEQRKGRGRAPRRVEAPALEAKEGHSRRVIASFLHDAGSPLAAMTSNLSVARELVAQQTDVGELREVLADMELATARLARWMADLRAYVGPSIAGRTFAELLDLALRLTHGQLSRRTRVEVQVDPTVTPALDGAIVLAALTELMIALSLGPTDSAARGTLTVRTEADEGLVLVWSPAPPEQVVAAAQAALERLGGSTCSSTKTALTLATPLAWQR